MFQSLIRKQETVHDVGWISSRNSKSQLRVEFGVLAAFSRPKAYLYSLTDPPTILTWRPAASHFLLIFSQLADTTLHLNLHFADRADFRLAIMISFLLFFLLLLDNGRSKDHIQVGNIIGEEVELGEDHQEEDELYNSGGEHGGDGQGDFEEVEGSGRGEVNVNLGIPFVVFVMLSFRLID